jgi:sulfur-oxidizing protein SoxA
VQRGRPAVPAEPLAPESDALLGLEMFVAHRSRGQPLAPPTDARLAPWREQGRGLYHQRIGQLDLSCADCHDRHAGGRLGGSTIPQGHPTAYPIYRLEWQAVGSLQRRLRNCQAGVRAEPDAFGSEALTALELFLVQRAAGMPLETPGVRP